MFRLKKITTDIKRRKYLRIPLIFALVIASALLAVGVLYYMGANMTGLTKYLKNPDQYGSSMVLFYDDNCSHCTKVDDFIKANKIDTVLSFSRLNIHESRTHTQALLYKAEQCNLDDSHIGVPFFWNGQNCIVGYVDIIAFFQGELKKAKK